MKDLSVNYRRLATKKDHVDFKQERDQLKDEYLKAVEMKEQIQQENNQLKAKLQ